MTIQSIVDRLKLYTLTCINEKSRLTDFSLLVCEFWVTPGQNIFSRSSEEKKWTATANTFLTELCTCRFYEQRKNFKNIESCMETQINVDDIYMYNKLCTTIINEMNNIFPKIETKSAKNRFRHKKHLIGTTNWRTNGKRCQLKRKKSLNAMEIVIWWQNYVMNIPALEICSIRCWGELYENTDNRGP